MDHKSGFVSIVGKPNVGKSTLMNQLVGERLSIITSKAQTTRHRILGIINGDNFQIVLSDTPGMLKPQYELHSSMMRFVHGALEDADLILYVTDLYEKHEQDGVIEQLNNAEAPIFLALNKTDLAKGSQAADKLKYWEEIVRPKESFAISALSGYGVEDLFQALINHIPHHPPYFPKDELTDKPERFFVSEIVREKIFLHYKKEVPYSCEVVTSDFIEEDKIIRIRVVINVERKSQRAIILGHKGERIKKVGTEARLDMEKFFGKKVFLEQFVKVEADWRKNTEKLKKFGY
jgi:GTP-binding protein Era